MERRCHTFDFDLSGGHDTLEQLVARARERTMQAGGMSSQRGVCPRRVRRRDQSIPGRADCGKLPVMMRNPLRGLALSAARLR